MNIPKERLLLTFTYQLNKNNAVQQMYIKNRRNSNVIKACGSNQILCLTESFVLRNRQLLIAESRCATR